MPEEVRNMHINNLKDLSYYQEGEDHERTDFFAILSKMNSSVISTSDNEDFLYWDALEDILRGDSSKKQQSYQEMINNGKYKIKICNNHKAHIHLNLYNWALAVYPYLQNDLFNQVKNLFDKYA